MARNIVICSDGTGNTFDQGVSNVTLLIRRIALDRAQIAVYDQGIGTNAARLDAVKEYRNREVPGGEDVLKILDAPAGLLARALGLAAGCGLKANVREMYRALAERYRGEEDQVFLFGFSRGAFTVRALAGLIYRCGLPRRGDDADRCFDRAWELYQPMRRDPAKVKGLKDEIAMHDRFAVHFLGIWDTVKSYGGLWPVMLPHLRHNPQVRTVRHALALDEHRGWFDATTWGQLDSDAAGAGKRLNPDELPEYRTQNIEEVWFRGCHSDIGGGDEETETAATALRWMLREAWAFGLRVNGLGESDANCPAATHHGAIHESMTWWWRLIDLIPRCGIDNSGVYPRRVPAWGSAPRKPFLLPRKRQVSMHVSVGVRLVETEKA
jgi:uncharacterized protein (DUF2235 family)